MTTDIMKTENTIDPDTQMLMTEDQTSALDLLMSAKNGIIVYAMALTETTNPQARTTLSHHLKEGLALHREISDLIKNKDWDGKMSLPKIHL